MSQQEKRFYEFGEFRIDVTKRRLLREGEIVPLAPKVFDVLLTLAEHSGKTIEKDELMQKVWPDAVVEENNLTQNIYTLRKILGESRNDNRFIVTVPGIGYRFVAEVRRVLFDDEEVAIKNTRLVSSLRKRLKMMTANLWQVALYPSHWPRRLCLRQLRRPESTRELWPDWSLWPFCWWRQQSIQSSIGRHLIKSRHFEC
jgi:DNA-binding winged helix-turn-helix (wHTH) protein